MKVIVFIQKGVERATRCMPAIVHPFLPEARVSRSACFTSVKLLTVTKCRLPLKHFVFRLMICHLDRTRP